MTANEAKALFANIPFNTSIQNIETFANEFAALTQGIDIDTDTITFEQLIINLGASGDVNEINIGASDSKLGAFGTTAVTQRTISNQTITDAVDLPTCITAAAEVKTIINSIRTALGDVAGYGIVKIG